MVVKVHFWNASSSRLNFGHVALELDDGTYISWWPGSRMKDPFHAFKGTFAKCYPSLDAEVEEQKCEPETYWLLYLDENKIKSWFSGHLEGSCRWDIIFRSCAVVVHKALSEGHDFFKQKSSEFISPAEVIELVRRYALTE
ncbi:hypothetical protein DPMN_045398 [Dreissena polymorpha]|uniref:Uncharacterized protein n=1 Tax=Dreissena polymorpha TaxID=45954 RepID=A0A9D4D652_DREPO|nr:hypothetical protein DPMN_045398 [Dreissena polymorpha]